MRKIITLVFFCLFGASWSWAGPMILGVKQDSVAPKATAVTKSKSLKIDSSKIQQRNFNAEDIKRLSKQKEFIYDDLIPAEMTWWDRFWRWFWDLMRRGLSSPNSGPILKYVLIGLGITAVVFIAIKLSGLDPKLFSLRSKNIEVPYEESLENIHEINFDEQLETALANKDYRLAVRLLYLKSLKKLSDLQLIDWKVEKTNQTYVAELTDVAQKSKFKTLTTQFEYVWYGEFFVDEPGYQSISKEFHQFNEEVK